MYTASASHPTHVPVLPLTPAVQRLAAPTLHAFAALLTLQTQRQAVTATTLAAATATTPSEAEAALTVLLQAGLIQASYVAILEPTTWEPAPVSPPPAAPVSPPPAAPVSPPRRRIRGQNLSLLVRAQRLCAAVPVGESRVISVRELAPILGYASAGRVTPTLRSLADLGVISRDPATRTLTMRRDPAELAMPGMLEPIPRASGSGDQRDRPIAPESGSGDQRDRPIAPESGSGDQRDRPIAPESGSRTSVGTTRNQTEGDRMPTDHKPVGDHNSTHEGRNQRINHESPLLPRENAGRSDRDSNHVVFQQLHPSVQNAHQQVNPNRAIPIGEWIELYQIQQEIGVDALLIASASAFAQDRPNGIRPNYYRVCFQRTQAKAARQRRQMPPADREPSPALPESDESARRDLIAAIEALAGETIRSAAVRNRFRVAQLTQLHDWLNGLDGARPWATSPLAVGLSALRDGTPLPEPPARPTDRPANDWGEIARRYQAQGYGVVCEDVPDPPTAPDAPEPVEASPFPPVAPDPGIAPWSEATIRSLVMGMLTVAQHRIGRDLTIDLDGDCVRLGCRDAIHLSKVQTILCPQLAHVLRADYGPSVQVTARVVAR